MCGVHTHVVTAAEIRDRHAADAKSLPYLVDMTAENFVLREVSADKAYASARNYDAIDRYGATPFIAFKANATGAVVACGRRCFITSAYVARTFSRLSQAEHHQHDQGQVSGQRT